MRIEGGCGFNNHSYKLHSCQQDFYVDGITYGIVYDYNVAKWDGMVYIRSRSTAHTYW